MKHFIKYSNASINNPKLLIYDNHESHMSIKVLDVAKENGVTILTLPPHTSHILQPLDKTCYASFKSAYNSSLSSMIMILKQPFTIYEIAECVHKAHDTAITPVNIKNGFSKTGIFPLNPDRFSVVDFSGSEFTDREISTMDNANINPEYDHALEERNEREAIDLENVQLANRVSGFLPEMPPQEVRGFPKANQRKITTQKRKRGKSIIATDSPERRVIREKQEKNQTSKKPSKKLPKKKSKKNQK